jgi:hypothetical protein
MATAGELVFDEQFGHLREIAASQGWQLERAFILGMKARDSSQFWLMADCTDYPALPPAWHWYNPTTRLLDQPVDTPKGGTFFHSSGCICAPWNRLAYKEVDPRGPHGNWDLANWMTNPKTGGCTTLSAMALRIQVELAGGLYQGRMG